MRFRAAHCARRLAVRVWGVGTGGQGEGGGVVAVLWEGGRGEWGGEGEGRRGRGREVASRWADVTDG